MDSPQARLFHPDGIMTRSPIFIGGPDRSGTTLLYALLASHPNISMARRSNMWRFFYDRYGDLAQPENFERCLHDMTHYHKMRHLGADPERIRREFWQGERSYGRLFALIHEHNAQRTGKPRWGDKSLHIEHYIEGIFAEFPDARVIQMVRDPRDRYASVRKRFGRDTPRLGASTARWLRAMRHGRRNLQSYPENYKIVRYESLARNTEETLQAICAFIDEEYSPVMLTMDGAGEYRESGGNSSFDRIEPGIISTRSIGRFQAVLSASEIAFIQWVCGPEMITLGYEKVPVIFPPGEKLKYVAVTLPLQLTRLVGWWALAAIETNRGERPQPPGHRQKQAFQAGEILEQRHE
jgi:hypothetical protein